MSAFTATPQPVSLETTVLGRFRKARRLSFAVPALILAYLIYAAIAFDLAGLAGRARMDNARILLADFVSYKTHVTRDNRSGALSVAVEGENKGRLPEGRLPDWVSQSGGETVIDLGNGHLVTYTAGGAEYDVPGYGRISVTPQGDRLELSAPQPLPDWISASDSRVSVTTDAGRFAYTRSKVETFRYQAGWPLFFFTPESPFSAMSWGEIGASVFTGERVYADLPNILAIPHDFLNNQMWRHGDTFWAMFETVLMAFLGTMGAALIALPLGFMAARNMMPFAAIRFAFRRLFDFIRGVDGLIWTIVLARAFGPGPMTGALAILLTDTGSFGKLFSEALENIDEKQVEGVRSTGANTLQRARFGVLPQVMPVLLSQVLYFLESNTRSATVIGAIVGGGIGLLLTQAIQTQKDWEDVAWYMVLIILMIMAMDSLSGWIRRKLIKGE
ncbi:phosphonate ABC transporter, permease protein PhnE [Pseudogemmobacter faecipullorum]|uniref:Phosphonate ABC transporter, permease protein PhnE n=1 Tax=Pseudogemmobacter faecipullorum TaxID=2755041 RepID=A0ABS8CS53_9RHOB|nr:phosphonate ABC transporter, permease protein PhnE [Pseudogemmobacter faecipullorum]MCB5412222.1 phosphonate ABC transporter, permease protein PhnE [Pseudogemmobacter faecipullorum]